MTSDVSPVAARPIGQYLALMLKVPLSVSVWFTVPAFARIAFTAPGSLRFPNAGTTTFCAEAKTDIVIS